MGNQVNRDFWDVHVEVTKKGDEMLTLFGQTIECFEKNTEPITCEVRKFKTTRWKIG